MACVGGGIDVNWLVLAAACCVRGLVSGGGRGGGWCGCCGLFLGNSTALLCLSVSQNPKSKIPIDKPRRIFRRGTNNNTISKT